MNLVVLIKIVADKRAVYVASVCAYVSVRSDNNAACRRGKRSRICTEVPHNIGAGALERCVVDVAEAQRIAAVVRCVNVDYDVHSAVFEQKFLKQTAIVRTARVVCIDVDYHGIAGNHAAAHYCGVCSRKRLSGASLGALNGFYKLVAARGDVKHVLVEVERLVLGGCAANGELVRADIQHVVMNAARNKACAVAVVGVVKLKVEAKHQLILHAGPEVRELYIRGLRRSRNVARERTAAVGAVADNIVVAQCNLVYLLNADVALNMVGGHALSVQRVVAQRVYGLVELCYLPGLACCGKNIARYPAVSRRGTRVVLVNSVLRKVRRVYRRLCRSRNGDELCCRNGYGKREHRGVSRLFRPVVLVFVFVHKVCLLTNVKPIVAVIAC